MLCPPTLNKFERNHMPHTLSQGVLTYSLFLFLFLHSGKVRMASDDTSNHGFEIHIVRGDGTNSAAAQQSKVHFSMALSLYFAGMQAENVEDNIDGGLFLCSLSDHAWPICNSFRHHQPEKPFLRPIRFKWKAWEFPLLISLYLRGSCVPMYLSQMRGQISVVPRSWFQLLWKTSLQYSMSVSDVFCISYT